MSSVVVDSLADKPNSHDVCFIADGDTKGFLARQQMRLAQDLEAVADAEHWQPDRILCLELANGADAISA